MSVSDDSAIRGIDTREILVFTFTGLKCTVLSVVGGVVSTANTIVDVLAVVSGVRSFGIADLEAEGVTTHKVVPFDDLLELAGERGGEDDTSHWVSALK